MADQTEQAIVKNEQYSVRQFSPSSWGGLVGDTMGFLWPRADLLPRWGSYECDLALRVLHYTQHNALVGGATQAYIEKFLSIPYEISGGRNLTYQWQDIFFEAEFGEGYDVLVTKGLVDYLTLNRGWFMEVVSYGSPDTPLQEGAKILGINHLDALRIYFTGNREWPYIYQSEWGGGLHKLHTTRIKRVVRQPSPDTSWFNMGKSALYDALTVANAQVMLGRHQNEMLNDLPPPGIVLFSNVKPDEVETAMRQFEYERIRDGQNVYRAPLSLNSKDPAQPATVTFIPLSTVPEGFDYEKYMTQHVNLAALNYGLDPQDIWPLSGQALGTGAQSKVLEAKTSVKGPGYLATLLTREWNKLLPRPLEWKYKAQNADQDKASAEIATLWTEIANKAQFASSMERRQLIANQVPAFADVLLDEQGNVRLPDSDPKEQGQEVIATDTEQLTAPEAPQTNVTATDQQAAPDTTPAQSEPTPPVTKAIDDTISAFVGEIQAAMQDGLDKVTSKQGTAARIRGAITRYGKSAYIDGLEDGGVDASEFDDSDQLKVSDIAVHDTQFVSDLVNEIYSDTGMRMTPETRAPLWAKTLNEFYYAGMESADRNGMYTFVGDDGKESCSTCQRLKGVTHRMKWWVSNQLRPGVDVDNFECKAYNCQHYLEKAVK